MIYRNAIEDANAEEDAVAAATAAIKEKSHTLTSTAIDNASVEPA